MATKKYRGHGEGAVYWREDRQQFYASVDLGTVNGRRVRKTVHAPSKAECLDKLSDLQREVRGKTITTSQDPTVEEWLASWIGSLEITGLKASTVRNYQNVIDFYVTDEIKRCKLRYLTAEHVDRMTTTLARAKMSTNTQRLARSVLRRAVGEAHKRGHVSQNVVSLSSAVAVKVNEQPVLTPEDAKRVLALVAEDSTQWLALYTLALHGLREGELVGLLWRDFDPKEETLAITGTFDAIGRERTDPKTDSSRRTISLTPEAVEVLTILKMEPGRKESEDGLIFVSRQGTPLFATTIRRHWLSVCKRLDLPPTRFHQLRHSCATILLNDGEPLEKVSTLLGHTSVRITADVYRHVGPNTTRETAQRLSSVLS
ncbi:MAG: site-specific integrase [Acidimicrobiales bacterium]|jgi:integrase